MTLREKAQYWLDDYKKTSNGDVVNMPSSEVIAAVFTEYLRESGDSAKKTALEGRVELLHEDLTAEQDKRRKLEEALQASEKACDYMGSQLTEARGKISAYEFVIRCNGVSGAEVRP